MNEKIGFTSTVPVEIILSAGYRPVDLNNIFINNPDPYELVNRAENEGFPRNLCAWVKGIYSAVKQSGVKKIICIGEGDCASAVSMCEVLEREGVEIIPFSYPMRREQDKLTTEMISLAEKLGTTTSEADKVRKNLERIRKKLAELDLLTWKEGKVRGAENHLWLVSSSDFNGEPGKFLKELEFFVEEVKQRKPDFESRRIGFIGVPPILTDLYEFINFKGGEVVYNETQRQFSFPFGGNNLIEQYLTYTYPYGILYRIKKDIAIEIKKRELHGIIHYVQSFCHRQIEDIIIRDMLDIPVLTLEADKPGPLDNRTKIRIEAFMEML